MKYIFGKPLESSAIIQRTIQKHFSLWKHHKINNKHHVTSTYTKFTIFCNTWLTSCAISPTDLSLLYFGSDGYRSLLIVRRTPFVSKRQSVHTTIKISGCWKFSANAFSYALKVCSFVVSLGSCRFEYNIGFIRDISIFVNLLISNSFVTSIGSY